MNFKAIILLFGMVILMASCKTQSSIVTSKYEAEKLGIYKAPPTAKKKVAKNTKPKTEEKKEIVTKQEVNHTTAEDYVITEEESYLAEQLVNKGYEFLGTPYRTGGTTTSGMDCSGFIIATFRDYNISLPRSSNEMSQVGVQIPMEQAKKGDLIFFRTNGRSVINHVGMVIESNGDYVKFIHSSTSQGVIISSTKEGYYNRTFAKINRVLTKS